MLSHNHTLQCLVLGKVSSRSSQELNSGDDDTPIKVSFQSAKHMYFIMVMVAAAEPRGLSVLREKIQFETDSVQNIRTEP